MANGNGGDSGSGDRATVALAVEKIDALKELTRAEFGALQRQLDPLAPLPAKVEGLTEKLHAIEQRVADIEKSDEKHGDWRRAATTTAVAFIVGTLVNLAINFHWF